MQLSLLQQTKKAWAPAHVHHHATISWHHEVQVFMAVVPVQTPSSVIKCAECVNVVSLLTQQRQGASKKLLKARALPLLLHATSAS